MKMFEEKFTAWVDGLLAGKELADFETELDGVQDADWDKLAAQRTGDLLREHGRAPELRNADFFNRELMRRIGAGTPGPETKPERLQFSWPLPRFAWAGACSLLIAFALLHFLIPTGPRRTAPPSDELAILNARSGDPAITATAFHSKNNNVTVLWLDGLKYAPDPHKRK